MSPHVLFSLFLLLLVSPPPLVSSSFCNQEDRTVLLEIKKHFGNPPMLSTWDPRTECCVEWTGIGCVGGGRVSLIVFLTQNALSGSIPSLFGDLPQLSGLTIANNRNVTGPIPASLAKLSNLRTLNLQRNRLSGPIPSFLCNMPSLSSLDLSRNRGLTGTVPECLGNKKSYVTLSLAGNGLTGPIPRSLADVHTNRLDLSDNRLVGDASFLFGENRRLVVSLARNQLEFDLSKVSYPLSMTSLDLSSNRIYGSISGQVSELKKGVAFDVSNNQLCGPIPAFFGDYSTTSFEHNKCLCGAPLPPCRHDQLINRPSVLAAGQL